MKRGLLPFTVLLWGVLAGTTVPSRDSSPQSATADRVSGTETSPIHPDRADSAHGSAVIEGTVVYQPDPQRLWRLARYYVANPGAGWLAEAVVALEGPHLGQDAPKPPLRNHTIDQLNFQFVPETLAIRAGDSVKILNSDDALHNVMTSDGSKPFNVSLAKGQQFRASFDLAGGLANPIRLGCLFHSQMHAWIYVFDHPWFAVTRVDGKFRFENLPSGRYTLGVVHPAGKLHWSREVEIQANGTVSLAVRLSPDNLAGSK